MPVTIDGGLRMEDEKETLVPMNPNYLILNCHLNIICYHKIVASSSLTSEYLNLR